MTDYRKKAEAYFREGYNCSQAVLLAFADELSIDRITAVKIASSFGGGMGKLREVCGAVSGMFMVAGLKSGYFSPEAKEEKASHYALIQKLSAEFTARNNSIICRELLKGSNPKDGFKPENRTEEYYKKRPCAELVGDAAEILAETLFKA